MVTQWINTHDFWIHCCQIWSVVLCHSHTHMHTSGSSPPACCSHVSDNLNVVLQPMWGRDYIFIQGVFILPLPSVTSSVAVGHLQELYSGVLGWERVWEKERGSDDSRLRNKHIPDLRTPSKKSNLTTFSMLCVGRDKFLFSPPVTKSQLSADVIIHFPDTCIIAAAWWVTWSTWLARETSEIRHDNTWNFL